MAERYRFSVAYEPAALESAVRAYVWKSHMGGTGWISTAATFAVVIGLSVYAGAAAYNQVVGAVAGVIAAVALAVVTYNWLKSRGRDAKLAMMEEPRAEFALFDDAVEVKTDRGQGRLAWSEIRQIWKFRRVWLLMMDGNRFVTLPLTGAPAEALEFLDKQIQPRPLNAA